MQKYQDSIFSLLKTTNLSPAVFSFLQPTDEFSDVTPLGGILEDTKHGWLALGSKFCVIDLRTGSKVAATIFGTTLSNSAIVTSVVELPTPLTPNSQQLIVSLQCDDISIICVLHVNGSQILRCIQTDIVVTQLSVCDRIHDGPFSCFDGVVTAGTKRGEVFVFDLNRSGLIQALKNISQGYEHLVQNETNPTALSFLPLSSIHRIEEQRELALDNDHHLGVLLNENSVVDNQYIFRNPDGSVRMKAKRDDIRVTVLQYIPCLGSLAVGYNFGAFQIWNLMNLDLEFTSQINVECLPVTHFGFQEPCDDPRAFCYLWVVFSVIDKYEEEEFPLAVMYSLTYQGKRMLSDDECLYQDFSSATIRFQVDLNAADDSPLLGGKCISCNTYSIKTALGDKGEDSMLNICQLVWECWGDDLNTPLEYGMLLFDLDQWYKDQMPATSSVCNSPFTSRARWSQSSGGGVSMLSARLQAPSLLVYSHATRLEEHFYPNSLQYNCVCLNTSEVSVLWTRGVQRQLMRALQNAGPSALLAPTRLYHACIACGLTPLYTDSYPSNDNQEDQRRFLLSVALEARLSRFLKRCAHDWATGTHSGVGCTLTFMVDWCWQRAVQLKENAKELAAPLFVSSSLPDRNIVRCLEHCVQQLTELTGLMDGILTKCCNLVVPDALSEMEERHKAIGTVSLYFQVVQWFLRVGLLPERHDGYQALPYPATQLYDTYNKRRIKLNRIQDKVDANDQTKSCPLLYIDQLIEHEFGGDNIHQMWTKGGSECGGLYPPPSLYSLLRLYLMPEIAEEHKHSLVLYLLVDYSMIYDDVRYETVIRRLMQFPTMFGLSNTAIKATQAFWHLDHRDFDFALDQLQCLTGNTLSDWQHNVVLSSLLAQKKTQAALQYLHVRKPAPIQNMKDDMNMKMSDHDKLEDWQSCCNLYLARGLVFEALDVVRMCAKNASTLSSKAEVLNFFFRGCRNTGNLSKVLQVTLLPFEEEVFIKYLEGCEEAQTYDILVMFYLQQARYLEAEQCNEKLKHFGQSSPSPGAAHGAARDALVSALRGALPRVAGAVAAAAGRGLPGRHTAVTAPKPMSVYVQANACKNTFTYKSSFIQDTIENASETWINKPKMRKGLKRALNIEETPFICTPKLHRSRSIFTEDMQSDSTPPKRAKLDFTGTPKTPKLGNSFRMSEKLTGQMERLLDMPEVQSPLTRPYPERADTPHSILKIRRNEREEAPSPVDSRYLGESDDEMLETGSNHTHYSDSTNKHLRFTIPTASESGSTPSPPMTVPRQESEKEKEIPTLAPWEKEMEGSTDSYATTSSQPVHETHPLESPPKKQATESNVVQSRKSYKDNVRARRSLSISANSSLSEDPNTSIESIADIPITLINPRYSGEKKRSQHIVQGDSEKETQEKREIDISVSMDVPKTPTGRRGIRSISESTPVGSRSGSATPERQDSPAATSMRNSRISRSRSKTPELSPRSSPLAPIPELPRHEGDSELHPEKTLLSVPRQLRSRSRTPERLDKVISESPRLEAIKESPTKSSGSSSSSPSRRSLRSRSRTPEVDVPQPTPKPSPRTLRARSKTPEKLLSPKKEQSVKTKKSLSRLVLEANTFAKTKQTLEMLETESAMEMKSESVIECTPMKTLKQVSSLMDVTLSPIVNKSVLQSSTDSSLSGIAEKESKDDKIASDLGLKPLPAFTTLQETYFEKSVLRSYQSSVADSSQSIREEKETKNESIVGLKSLPAFNTITEEFNKSVLHSYESSVAESSQSLQETVAKELETPEKTVPKPFVDFAAMIDNDFEKSVLRSQQSSMADSTQEKSSLITNDSDADLNDQNKDMAAQKEKEQIVEIEREINEIEDEMSNDSQSESGQSNESEDVDVEESDEETEESTSTEESSASSEAEEEQEHEVISIGDTDSDNDTNDNDQNKQSDITETNSNAADQATSPEVNTEKTESSVDPLNQAQVSLLTDDNSLESSEQEISLNYSDEKSCDEKGDTVVQKEIPRQFHIEVTVEEYSEKDNEPTTHIIPTIPSVDVVDNTAQSAEKDSIDTKANQQEKDSIDSVNQQENMDIEEHTKITEQSHTKESDDKEQETSESDAKQKKESRNKTSEITEKPTPRTRKRAASTSSNKSKETEVVDEPKTPVTRKRSQSSKLEEKLEEKTPEDVTPTRRRGKTPSEVRKIITRRVSREMAEKLNDSNRSLDDSLTSTPKKTRSKKNDDNESVASESSFVSNKSKASEDEVKTRKGRKSVVATKPDLSVIPEVIAEDSNKDIEEYTGSRRLSRTQKSRVESWLSPSTSRPRRLSTASRSTAASEHDDDERHPAFDVQQMDRISLLNKEDFEGSPDVEEMRELSPESIASDASTMRRARLGRAASETKTIPKAAKINRRVASVDVASPASPASRSRRASFTRACEALHTPKGRRASTDARKDEVESPLSPEEARPRRPGAKGDAGKRSKKLPVLEEVKETMK